MEKTVVVVAANGLSAASCGQTISFDLSLGKGKSAANSRTISKTLWTCCVESVTEYCRIIFDLFPAQFQICVAAVDEAKCQPINSWRDEDQEIGKVLLGFQKFGLPQFQLHHGGAGAVSNHLNPCIQGLQYAVRCLAQLTATQYACMTTPGAKPPTNQGRILFLTTLKSAADVKELEKSIVGMVRSENQDIKLKGGQVRLPLQHCQLVIINTHAPMVHPSDIKDSPRTQLSPLVSAVTYSFPAKLLLDKCISLAKMHFDLKSTIITGIPMKEEQSGGSSANYDVELMHKAEAHRDIQRAGYGLGPLIASKNSKDVHGKDSVFLKWSTPKSTALDLQFCTSCYRVTPRFVTARPTICLINFVLSGKPVLLEQPRKGPTKVISHVLCNHAGAIFLHCIPANRSFLDDPPSISEGWGGRVTDYRITDFSELVKENALIPHPYNRTKIPSVYPIQLSLSQLERETRHWPMVFNDTVVYTLPELEPIWSVIKRETMSDAELDECKKVILSLQAKESSNEQLPIPSSGTRNKGAKRDEQYRMLWSELETLGGHYSDSSDHHRQLSELIQQAVAHSPSMQLSRKTPTGATDSSVLHTTPGVTPTELAWQEMDRYQSMTERERRDFNTGNRNNEHGMWQQQSSLPPSHPHPLPPSHHHPLPLLPPHQKPHPIPAKPVASVLALWSSWQRTKASNSHPEFSGRLSYGPKAHLYSKLGNSSVMPPDQDS